MTPTAATRPHRAVCPRCLRPVVVCYCAALPALRTRTRVVILQHARERGMPIGTARMAALCLPDARLHVAFRFAGHAGLQAALSDPDRPPILLYPDPGARDVLREPPAGPVTLVVVDGTWSQARRIVRDTPELAGVARYAFRPPEPSQYRVRREPRAEYVSTIEALAHVLGALEGDPEGFRALLTPFRAMVDAHLARQAPGVRKERPRVVYPRSPFVPRLPAALAERALDLLLVVGEANAWPYAAAGRRIRHELVHWVALRPATGESFDMVAAPEQVLAPNTPELIGVAEARLRTAGSRSELLAAFDRFARPTDVVLAWGPYGPRLFREAGGSLPPERIDLREAARAFERRKIGTLEAYGASLGLGVAPGAPEGAGPAPAERALRRIRLLAGILAAWQARAGVTSSGSA